MPTEIEHKYLVNETLWNQEIPEKSIEIKQGYIFSSAHKTIRIRTANQKGYLTIKGETIGASRAEFEYEIPIAEAEEMLQLFCTNCIEKTRHLITFEDHIWEVDVFKGNNKGLIIAEIELKNELAEYALPAWALNKVTADAKYANANLAKNPYCNWH